MTPERLIPPVVLGLVALTVAGALFLLGREAGLKAGASTAAAQVERLGRDLSTCKAGAATLEAAIGTQNRALEARDKAARAAAEQSAAALAQARRDGADARARAERILNLKPAGDACAQAGALLREYGR